MSFVLDNSVALAWLLPDEGNDAVDALADRLVRAPAHVPAIWQLEVTNALLVALRRERITDADVDRLIEVLSALPIEVDRDWDDGCLPRVLVLARRFGLTSYDASYLELAERRGLPLATLDARLGKACRTLKLHVLP